MKFLFAIAGTVLAALSLSNKAQASILPKNDLHLYDNVNFAPNMTEQEFKDIVNNIVDKYKPIVKTIHNADLTANNLWQDSTVNASAEQRGNSWIINMYGGLARRPEVTPDGFAMVVCHELGHHLGGFAFYKGGEWAANEGQADYFATMACAKYIWGEQHNENAKARSTAPTVVKEKCDAVYSTTNEQNLCYRTALAGKSLAELLATLERGPVPKFETPDSREVSSTADAHPAAQCRLDTYVSGALCGANWDVNLIPGRNHADGQESLGAEEIAAQHSCTSYAGQTLGLRPRCWFKPKLEFMGILFSKFSYGNEQGSSVVKPGDKVALDFALTNGASTTTRNVIGTLATSSPSINILTATQSYGDIAPKEIKSALSPFVVQIAPNAQCGTKAEVTMTARVGESFAAPSVQFKGVVEIGKFLKTEIGTNTNAVRIPDANRAGVTSIISSTTGGSAAIANVALHLKHTYPKDLQLTLIAPSGETKAIDLGPVRPGNIQQVYNVEIQARDSAGDWRLLVVDTARQDEGSLETWSLTLSKAVCE